jgi:hypothetical protein
MIFRKNKSEFEIKFAAKKDNTATRREEKKSPLERRNCPSTNAISTRKSRPSLSHFRERERAGGEGGGRGREEGEKRIKKDK